MARKLAATDDAVQVNGPNDDIGEATRLELYRLQVVLRDAEQRAYDLFPAKSGQGNQPSVAGPGGHRGRVRCRDEAR